MLNKSSSNYNRSNLSKAIITGVVSGGVIGTALGFLHEYGILAIPGLSSMFYSVPMNATITGTITGVVVGVIISSFIAFFSRDESLDDTSHMNNEKLQLREERLDIAKKRIQKAEVTMHKESFTEEKTFNVPVTREELVIEKKFLNDGSSETIRIPIKDERVEIVKHPVALEDVSYHIEEHQENKVVQETLKKERLKVEHEGSVPIVENNNKTTE